MKKLYTCKITLDTVFVFDQENELNGIYHAAEEAFALSLKDYYFEMEHIHEIKTESDIPEGWLHGGPYRQELFSTKEISTLQLLNELNERANKQNDPEYLTYLKLKKKFENK